MRITAHYPAYFALPRSASEDAPPPDAYVRQAEEGGAQFHERKRFHLPWTEPTRPLEASDVLEKLDKGRVEATSPESKVPIRLDSIEEIKDLATLQSNGNDRARAIHALAEDGWRFHARDGTELGAYGAYNGEARAHKDGRAVPMEQPELVWKFYDPRQPALGAVLESQGYRFYQDEEQIPAFGAPADARVGKDEGWLRLEELTEGKERESLLRFERLHGLAESTEQARAAYGAGPGELDRLLTEKIPSRLALEATEAGEAEVWSRLPALGSDGLEHIAPRSDAARLALSLCQAVGPERTVLYRMFSHDPPDPTDLVGLSERGRDLRQGQAAYQQVLLERMLDEPTETPVLARQARLVKDDATREQTLARLAERPECAGLKACWERWSPVLVSPDARRLMQDHLLSDPLGADTPAAGQALADRLRRAPASEREAFASVLLRDAVSREDAPTVAARALQAGRSGQVGAANEALELLVARPECAEMKARLDVWSPGLESAAARSLLREHLLRDPLGAEDRRQVGSDLLVALARSRQVESSERGRFAVTLLRQELAAGDLDAIAARAREANRYGQAAEVGETLEVLAGRPECAGLKGRLAAWSPVVTSSAGSRILRDQLLAEPRAKDDAATRREQAANLLSAFNHSREVKFAEKGSFAAACLREELATGEVDAIAAQALTASVYGQAPAVGEALEYLAGRPECAALKSRLAAWSPVVTGPAASKILREVLLREPRAKDDAATRREQAAYLLSAFNHSREVKFAEKGAFAAACLREELATGEVDAIAAQALTASVYGQAPAVGEALEYLAGRPECAGLKSRLAAWGGLQLGAPGRKILNEQLLRHYAMGEDPVGRRELESEIRRALGRARDVDRADRAAFTGACLREEMQNPADIEAIARAARIAMDHQAPVDEALALLTSRPECAGLKARLEAWGPALTSRMATRILRYELLADPTSNERVGRAQKLLTDLQHSSSVEAAERAAFARACLDEVAGDPGAEFAEILKMGSLALRVGQSGQPALDRLAQLPECEGLKFLSQDLRWEGMSGKAERALAGALLANPRVELSLEGIEAIGSAVMGAMPREERARFEEILAGAGARLEVMRLAQPERTQGIAEGDSAVVVGGVVVKKRESV